MVKKIIHDAQIFSLVCNKDSVMEEDLFEAIKINNYNIEKNKNQSLDRNNLNIFNKIKLYAEKIIHNYSNLKWDTKAINLLVIFVIYCFNN